MYKKLILILIFLLSTCTNNECKHGNQNDFWSICECNPNRCKPSPWKPKSALAKLQSNKGEEK